MLCCVDNDNGGAGPKTGGDGVRLECPKLEAYNLKDKVLASGGTKYCSDS